MHRFCTSDSICMPYFRSEQDSNVTSDMEDFYCFMCLARSQAMSLPSCSPVEIPWAPLPQFSVCLVQKEFSCIRTVNYLRVNSGMRLGTSFLLPRSIYSSSGLYPASTTGGISVACSVD